MQIHELSARQLAAAQDAGELSAVEIVRALHDRADAVNGAVNGWAHQLRADALREAEAADASRAAGRRSGPLHGLPISVKENIATAGLACTLGLAWRREQIEREDAVVVALARGAGAIVVGKGNVPQFLLAMESENPLWGVTRNPWDPSRASGGSSGGEAALVASGQVPWSLATDVGGSIRQPASFCGVVGIKPTERRWSTAGARSAIPGQEAVRSQTGVIARSTADVAWLLRTLDSPLHSPLDPAVPPLPIGDPAAVALSGLRVGFYEDDGLFTPSAALRRAVREAAGHLRAAGAEVLPYTPPNVEAIAWLMFSLLSADGTRTLLDQLHGEPISPQLEPVFKLARLPAPARRAAARLLEARGEPRVAGLLRALGRKPVETLWRLTHERDQLRMAERSAWDDAGLHAVICPPHATPAVRYRESGDFSLSSIYAMRYNLLNLPAGTVPVTRVRPEEQRTRPDGDRIERKAARMDEGSAGLPACVQVVGRAWREDVVLAVMEAIEAGARAGADYPVTPVDPP